jgi:hypothetical protein
MLLAQSSHDKRWVNVIDALCPRHTARCLRKSESTCAVVTICSEAQHAPKPRTHIVDGLAACVLCNRPPRTPHASIDAERPIKVEPNRARSRGSCISSSCPHCVKVPWYACGHVTRDVSSNLQAWKEFVTGFDCCCLPGRGGPT